MCGTLSPAASTVFASKSFAFLDDSSISRSFSYPKNRITSCRRKQGPEKVGRLSSSNTFLRRSSEATMNIALDQHKALRKKHLVQCGLQSLMYLRKSC